MTVAFDLKAALTNTEDSYPSLGHVIFYILFVLAYGMQSGSRRHCEMLAADRLMPVKVQEVISFSSSAHSYIFVDLLRVFVILRQI